MASERAARLYGSLFLYFLGPEKQSHKGDGAESDEGQEGDGDESEKVNPGGGAWDAAVAHCAMGKEISFLKQVVVSGNANSQDRKRKDVEKNAFVSAQKSYQQNDC